MTTMRVSLCMIVKDEAAWLPRCLKSARECVEEIVIADTGSQDETPAIAQAHGARVISLPWREDFAEARNATLALATGDWILQLDADEELAGRDRDRLRRMIGRTDADAFRLRVRSLLTRRDLAAYEEERLVRLFRNRPAYRYTGRVQEQIRPAIERAGGAVRDADVTILHRGYVDGGTSGPDRRLRTLALLESALGETAGDPTLCYRIGSAYHAQGDRARAQAFLIRALLGKDVLENDLLPQIYRRLAQLALAGDEFEASRRYARACLEAQPGDLVSLYVLGLADFLQGRPDRACNQFERIQHLPSLNPARSAELATVLGHCRRILRQTPAVV